MSIAGYFGVRRPELRMPKKGDDRVGARFEGAVLSGEKTVEERLKDDSLRPGGACYECVEDYDPVLRAHCRLSV